MLSPVPLFSRLFFSLFFILYSFSISSLKASEEDLAAMLALGDLTNAPNIYDVNGDPTTWRAISTAAKSSAQSIYYDGLDYLGSPTRVFALIKLPETASATDQTPGVVLVHGGGGTAIEDWVNRWAARGYTAIAMDNEGGNIIDGVRTRPHPWGAGPDRTGIYRDSEPENLLPLDEQWEYHATSTVIIANSLLRSLPEVDPTKVGVTGVSWGGVLTSTAIGIDDRFAFAIPVYGCGRLFDVGNQYGRALGDNVFYQTVMDPLIRISNSTIPTLWSSWPRENNFSLDSQAATYFAATSSQRMVSLVPDMGHGHAASYARQETYDFADSVISTGSMWATQESLSLNGSTVEVVFKSTKPLFDPTLVYTTGTGYTGNLTWPEIEADSIIESPAGTWTIIATLPTDATAWFVNVNAQGSQSGFRGDSIIMSSDYQEVIKVAANLSDQQLLDFTQTNTTASANINITYTAPTNLEITSLAITGESHVGAFTVSPEEAIVLNSSPPTGTEVIVQFNNDIASPSLTLGETATGSLSITWEEVDGSLNSISLPLSSTFTTAELLIFNTTTNWSAQTVRAVDDVIIRNNATVNIDQDSAVNSLTINDDGSSAYLTLDQNYTLLVSENLDILEEGVLNLNNGTLNYNGSALNIDGQITVDGGTWESSNLSLAGSGTFELTSGSVSTTGAAVTTINKIKISGGSIDFGSTQVQIGRNSPTDFCISGSDASIKMAALNQQSARGNQGTFHFIFDETGVSPIQVSAFLHLATATVNVDGSNYTGGPGSFPLIDSTNLITLASNSNLNTTGFNAYGLDATFEQDPSAGADWLQLTLTNNDYAIWATENGLTGSSTNAFADPDSDGSVNIIEYVLNRSPSQSPSKEESFLTPTILNQSIQFTFNRLTGSDDITTQIFQYSSDLLEWTDIPLSNPSVSIEDSVNGMQAVNLLMDRSLAEDERLFARLKVTLK